MSENNQKVVVMPLKSPMVGFLLAFLGLGWFGIDRFYKGDTKIGLFKLFCVPLAGILFLISMAFPMLALLPLVVLGIGGFFWLLDWFLVPLGISRDNARKLAQANGTQPNTQNSAPQAEYAVTKQVSSNSAISASNASVQTSADSQAGSDLVVKIVFALILFVAVISWLLRQFG